jgi:hypothetical protein
LTTPTTNHEEEQTMEITDPDATVSYAEVAGGNIRPSGGGSFNAQSLLHGIEGAPNNYRFNIATRSDGPDQFSPRHRHTFDQFRYFIAGDYLLADEPIPAGSVGYFPESVHYGPQVIPVGSTICDVQFGGASGNGFLSLAQRKAGFERLIAKGGRLEDGLHITVDASGKEHKQDGFEALQQEVFGKQVVYAPPRYSGQTIMHPDNFAWVKDPDFPGVARKTLGVFTERDARVGFIQLEKGASFLLGEQPAPELLFVVHGSLAHDGVAHPAHSAFGTWSNEDPQKLTAEEDTELLYFKLTTF